MKDKKEKNTLNDDVETLDFEVSNEIEEVLDFVETPKKDKKENKFLDDILSNAKKDKQDISIDLTKEKLDEYKPSLKDFNIKSAKKRKIVKKVLVYTIIVMLFTIEFLIEKAGNTLNDLKVYASNNNPIRIILNEKYGYIDNSGNKLVNPKYLYGEEFIDGFAIVKNGSNLPLIIDKGGKVVEESGKYFSIYRADKNIIASKATKDGLKYGVLSSYLKKFIPFKYDTLYYVDGVYTYSKENEVGIINKEGKEIYKFELTDKDDKIINIDISKINDKKFNQYGVVKVNSSSVIINVETGKVVFGATLENVVVDNNNVFYIEDKNKKRYLYVYNDEIVLESDTYSSITVDSIGSGIIKAINNKFKTEYISVKTKEQLDKTISSNSVCFGDNIFVYKTRDYKKNKNVYNLVKNGEVYNTLYDIYGINKCYSNGLMIVKYEDGKYGIVDEEGKFINKEHYDSVEKFDKFGDAIVTQNGNYGVINKNGKEVLKTKYDYIVMAPYNTKVITSNNSFNVFYAAKNKNEYELYNKNGKKVDKETYNDVLFDEKYPIVKLATSYDDKILLIENNKKVTIPTFTYEYQAFENYIIIDKEYYNYNGKMIYMDNSKK